MRLILVYFKVKLVHTSNIVSVDLDVLRQFVKAMEVFEIEPIDPPCDTDFDIFTIEDLNLYISSASRYSTKKISV